MENWERAKSATHQITTKSSISLLTRGLIRPWDEAKPIWCVALDITHDWHAHTLLRVLLFMERLPNWKTSLLLSLFVSLAPTEQPFTKPPKEREWRLTSDTSNNNKMPAAFYRFKFLYMGHFVLSRQDHDSYFLSFFFQYVIGWQQKSTSFFKFFCKFVWSQILKCDYSIQKYVIDFFQILTANSTEKEDRRGPEIDVTLDHS